MNQIEYTSYRQKLLGLMDDALAIEDIPIEAREELQETQRTLLEDSFEIVLIGEFQGGKSTTFNALCDGREISPRGALIKTSACRISAHNLADLSKAEYARIEWKSDVELLKTIIDIVASGVKKRDSRRFPEALPNSVLIGEVSKHQTKDLPAAFRPLDIIKDVKLLKSVLKDEWEAFRENPVAYDRVSAGRQDMLYIATLIVEHCSSREIRKHLSVRSEEMPIDEMAKFVKFPDKWETRWADYPHSTFLDSEVLFAFIARVDCFIHSNNLGRMGCVITDCPGLFASDWDTRVATDAMKSAHAIAYLFGGERAIGNQETAALQHIRSLGLEKNLFYVFNAKTRIGQAKSTIVPENISKLRNQGYKFENGELNIYHALLGLCSRNATQIENNVDGFSQNRFCELASRIYEEKFVDAKEAWGRVVDDNLYNYLDRCDHGKIPALLNSPAMLGECSGLDSIVNKIEKFVLGRRARSLLVDRGANRVKSAIASALQTLKTVKADAEKNAADALAECTAAEEAFSKFQREAKGIIDQHITKKSIGVALVSEFVDDVFMRSGVEIADRVAGELAEDIASKKTKYVMEASLEKLTGKASAYIHGTVETCFRKHFERIVGNAVEAWVLKIKSGENETFNDEFGYAISRASKLLHEKWDEIREVLPPAVAARLGDIDFLPSEMNVAAGCFSHNQKAADVLGNMSFAFIASTVCPVIVAGIVYGVIVGIVANITTGFIPILIAVIGGVIAAIFAAEKVHSVIVAKIKSALLEKLKGTVTVAFQNPDVTAKIRMSGQQLVDAMKKSCADMFEDLLDKQKRTFESRIATTKRAAQLKQGKEKEFAEHYANVISNQLHPLLQRTEAFIAEVK